MFTDPWFWAFCVAYNLGWLLMSSLVPLPARRVLLQKRGWDTWWAHGLLELVLWVLWWLLALSWLLGARRGST